MKISDFKGKKVAVWGYGAEGKAAESFLRSQGILPLIITDDSEDELQNMDLVVKSPGISLYKDVIKQAKAKGTNFVSGTELFLRYVRLQNKKPVLIAVTGTKGKSTISALLTHLLKNMGKRVFLGGNFGEPLLCAIPSLAEYDYIVAEISSYQSADLKTGFDVVILNNLYPEHVNWHGSHQQYFKDKLNVVLKSKVKIVNKNDQKTAEFMSLDDVIFFNDIGLCSQNDLSLPGEHNVSNANAVLTCLKVLRFTDISGLKKHLKTFEPLPHRLQEVAKKSGITFVDDSISTTPETAIAALRVYKDSEVTLLVGGFERQQDYTNLYTYIKNNNVRVITLPSTGGRIYKELSESGVEAIKAEDMRDAVGIAKKITRKGGVVLLSPAAPSYDFYKNFQERGKFFADCI